MDVSDKMKEPSKGDGLSARFIACDDPFIISKGCLRYSCFAAAERERLLAGHQV